MPTSRFPRQGQRIAPEALSDLLEQPITARNRRGLPSRYAKLRDLDEDVLLLVGESQANALAKEVVEQLRPEVIYLISERPTRRLPVLPSGKSTKDLSIQVRTSNCLLQLEEESAGTPRRESWTVGSVLTIPGFGIKCLVDLLVAVEAVTKEAHSTLTASGRENNSNTSHVNLATPNRGSTRGLHFGEEQISSAEAHKQLVDDAKMMLEDAHSEEISRYDLRFGEIVTALHHSARTAKDFAYLIVHGQYTPKSVHEILGRMRKLRSLMASAMTLKLEDELKELLGSSLSDRNWEIVAAYYGLARGHAQTLDATAKSFGITRSRVQQICKKPVKAIGTSVPFSPSLDRALEVISVACPAEADTIEACLSAENITSLLHIDSIIAVSRLMNRAVTFQIESFAGKNYVVPVATPGIAEYIGSVARRNVEHWGVATLLELSSQVSEHAGYNVTTELVKSILTGLPEFHLLDAELGWFTITDTRRNRLLNTVRKVLSIARQLPTTEIRRCVSRHRRMFGFAPPRRIIEAFCRTYDTFAVLDGVISDRANSGWRTALKGTEHTFVRILSEHGGVLQRELFEEKCIKSGMNRATFYAYLTGSPVVLAYARGVYGLPGADFPIGTIAALTKRNRRNSVMVDASWTEDGAAQLIYRMSASLILSGSCGVAAGISGHIQGDYILRSEDDVVVGTLRIKGTSLWGLGPFFRRRGGEPGDYMSLLIRLDTRSATIAIGDHIGEDCDAYYE